MEHPPPPLRLPPVIDLLWGRATKARRGPRPELSVERIVEAAIELADAEGLGAVSMARVADRLGFTAMSLYRHVPTKDDLLLLMGDAGLPMPPATFARPGDADWRPATERWCLLQLDALVTRPWLAEAGVVGLALPGPRRLAWIDRGLACLEPTGLDAATRFAHLGALSVHILGEARLTREFTDHAPDLARALGAGDDEAAAANNPFGRFEAVLTELGDPDHFPALARAVAAGALADEDWSSPDDAQHEDAMMGVRLILDGIAEAARRSR